MGILLYDGVIFEEFEAAHVTGTQTWKRQGAVLQDRAVRKPCYSPHETISEGELIYAVGRVAELQREASSGNGISKTVRGHQQLKVIAQHCAAIDPRVAAP